MTMIEEQVRNVMARQAAAMHVPDARPGEQLARVTQLPTTRRRPHLLMAAAVAVLVLGAGVALLKRRADDVIQQDPAAATGFHFDTPTVLLDAATVEVTVAGKTFVPTTDLQVHSNPVYQDPYTTLELSWHDGDIEQRISIYFASDGTNWWATEIRTYNGQPVGDWVEPTAQGEFFKSPLGSQYVGDLDLPNLHVRGMRLEAFRRPSACTNSTQPLVLIADYPTIDESAAPEKGFAATAKVIDTATCKPVPADHFSFDVTVDDSTIATNLSLVVAEPTDPIGMVRFSMGTPKAGTTIIHVTVRDATTHAIVDQVDIPVTIR